MHTTQSVINVTGLITAAGLVAVTAYQVASGVQSSPNSGDLASDLVQHLVIFGVLLAVLGVATWWTVRQLKIRADRIRAVRAVALDEQQLSEMPFAHLLEFSMALDNHRPHRSGISTLEAKATRERIVTEELRRGKDEAFAHLLMPDPHEPAVSDRTGALFCAVGALVAALFFLVLWPSLSSAMGH